jgi:hypothetical protein
MICLRQPLFWIPACAGLICLRQII